MVFGDGKTILKLNLITSKHLDDPGVYLERPLVGFSVLIQLSIFGLLTPTIGRETVWT